MIPAPLNKFSSSSKYLRNSRGWSAENFGAVLWPLAGIGIVVVMVAVGICERIGGVGIAGVAIAGDGSVGDGVRVSSDDNESESENVRRRGSSVVVVVICRCWPVN